MKVEEFRKIRNNEYNTILRKHEILYIKVRDFFKFSLNNIN